MRDREREQAHVNPIAEPDEEPLIIVSRREDTEFAYEMARVDGDFIAIVSGRGGNRTKNGYVSTPTRLKQAIAAHVLQFKAAMYDGKPNP